MIYTDMEHLDRYRGICPQLDTAIGYLMENGLEFLVPGRNEVDGEDVFVNRFHYAAGSCPPEGCRPAESPRPSGQPQPARCKIKT